MYLNINECLVGHSNHFDFLYFNSLFMAHITCSDLHVYYVNIYNQYYSIEEFYSFYDIQKLSWTKVRTMSILKASYVANL